MVIASSESGHEPRPEEDTDDDNADADADADATCLRAASDNAKALAGTKRISELTIDRREELEQILSKPGGTPRPLRRPPPPF